MPLGKRCTIYRETGRTIDAQTERWDGDKEEKKERGLLETGPKIIKQRKTIKYYKTLLYFLVLVILYLKPHFQLVM